MNQTLRERIALSTSVVIIGAAVWFWILQIGDVLKTLRLAAGG